jgi:hypothetical protein
MILEEIALNNETLKVADKGVRGQKRRVSGRMGSKDNGATGEHEGRMKCLG